MPTGTTGAPQRPLTAPQTYRQLLALRGAAAFFAAASTGRTGVAATGLGLVWLVHGASGSFGAAGAAVAAFAVAEAVAGPQVARAVDRWGQTAVLPAALGVHAVAVLVLVTLVTGAAPGAAVVAAAALAGASAPQLGAMSSVRWALLLRDHRDALPRAFALESLANALAFLAGPVLVSALAAAGRPWAGSAGALVLVVGGGLALSLQRRTAPPGRGAGRRRAVEERPAAPTPAAAPGRRALRRPVPLLLVGASGLLGVHFGGVPLVTAAWGEQLGGPAAAAPLVAASSFAGLAGAWAFGLRTWRTAPLAQVAGAGGFLALGCGLVAAAGAIDVRGGATGTSVALLVGGLVLASVVVPVVVVQVGVVLEREVPRGVLTEALAWTGSASAAGSAVGAAVVGRVVDGAGAGTGAVVLVVVAGLLTGLATWAHRVVSLDRGRLMKHL
ncbi:MFS transporter [Quadrisphaera setariae]|uniref:MFS transporter n=1 Tax=Quadrisphaera setariae TaxID=2593304 RepID=UPI00164F225F|nr:MFS transporter [Quadrisphaera setariae]